MTDVALVTARTMAGVTAGARPALARAEFAVEGVACGGCIAKIERALTALDGVTDARMNLSRQRLFVSWQLGSTDAGALVAALAALGYRAHVMELTQADESGARESRRLLTAMAVAGFAAMNVMLLSVSIWAGEASDIDPATRDLFHLISGLIAVPAAAYAGQPFFGSAASALKARRLNMDVPISLGVILALALSIVETLNHAPHAYFDSAIMLLFFLLVGRYLDQAARQRTQAVAANLAAFRVQEADRIGEDGALMRVAVASLRPGDHVLVAPGARVPVDGRIVTGASSLDESPITGETQRRAVTAGDAIHAGSLNFDGSLTLSVTAAGEDTLIDEIERLLHKAAGAKSSYIRLADRVSQAYAPVVHFAALGTGLAWWFAGSSAHDALVTAIAVLIITCPCALALAVPAVQVVASGALFRRGVLIHAGDALERLASVDTIVFDKTGTLTHPEPQLVAPERYPPDTLAKAARLAAHSHHPLAVALARARDGAQPLAIEAVEEPGQGVRARIDGVEARLGSAAFCSVALISPADADPASSFIAFAHGDDHALFEIRQTLRPDATATIAGLRALGLEIVILSGDRPEAVARIADTLGVRDWRGSVKPAAKIAWVEAIQLNGRRVLMVGDGINDAPALAAAHVSMSPVSATDLAQAQADLVFLGERLGPILSALRVARRAHAVTRENLALAIGYNVLAVPLAMAGLVTPLIAAAAMSGSSILVTLNALRAGRLRDGPST